MHSKNIDAVNTGEKGVNDSSLGVRADVQKLEDVEEQNKKLRKESIELQALSRVRNLEIDRLNKKIVEYKKRQEQLKEQIAELVHEKSKLSANNAKLYKRINSLEQEKSRIISEKKTAEQVRDKFGRENTKLQQENQDLKDKLNTTRKKGISTTTTLYSWLSSCWNNCAGSRVNQDGNRHNASVRRRSRRRPSHSKHKHDLKILLAVAVGSCVLTSFAIACYWQGGIIPLMQNSYKCSYNTIVGYANDFTNFCCDNFNYATIFVAEWSAKQVSSLQSVLSCALSNCYSYCAGKIYDFKCTVNETVVHIIDSIAQKASELLSIC